MKLLINSHTAYWWTVGDDRSTRAEEMILDDANVTSSQCSFDLRA